MEAGHSMKRNLRIISAPFYAKMLICLILTVVIPLSVFIPLLHVYQSTAAEKEINNIHQERSYQASEQLDMIYEQINSVSNLFFLDSDIESILRTGTHYEHQRLADDNAKIIRLQQRYNSTIPKVDMHVTIIANDYRIYGDASYDVEIGLSAMSQKWWYQQLLDSPWQTLWIKDNYLDILHGANDLNYIYSVRFLKRFDDWKNQGLLIVSFLESDLIKLYANAVPTSGSMFILNQNGNLISMVDNASVYDSGILERLQDGYSSSYVETIGNLDYQIVTNTVRTPLWKVVTITPAQQLRMQYSSSSLLIPALTVVFLIILLVFSIMISHYIVNPIKELTNSVQRIGQSQDLSERITIRSQDEIGLLSTEFNNMMDRINHLMVAMVNEQTAKRSAELRSLYAQINPHFIYNAITSIRVLITSGENARADQALHAFALLLRSSISDNDELCSIQQEINLLDKYISIQQLFFDEPIQVKWDISPELYSCKIIKLSLQPIVENAILHGLKSKRGIKILSIKIESVENDILATVTDNGIGSCKNFSFDSTSSEYNKSLGMKNVHRRLSLMFGEPYGLQFSSTPGEGTSVKLLFPKINQRKEIM